jgi:hypothetical protein
MLKKKKPDRRNQAFSVQKTNRGNLVNKTNLTQHPCANKCSNFKEEQCNHCLVQINCYQDEDQSMGTRTIIESDFVKGDTVVFVLIPEPALTLRS